MSKRTIWAVLGICAMTVMAANKADHTQAVWQTESETEYETETQEAEQIPWESETTREEAASERGTESETESETETEKKTVHLSDIRVKQPERYYDGTREVELEGMVSDLPEGMSVDLRGYAKQKDTGTWPVEIEAILQGAGSEEWNLEIEDTQNLYITILPRPLQIIISGARKPYHSANELSEVIFEETEPIKVTGFLEQDCIDGQLPKNFQLPELMIDEQILSVDSPMYENGKEICYRHAITVKTEKDGSISGNPGENYTFYMEGKENIQGGTVILSAPPILGTLDYTLECSDSSALVRDENGNVWVRQGESLYVRPVAGRGFTFGKNILTVQKDGEMEFTLTERNENGEVTASSQIRSIAWKADGEAPKAEWTVDGKTMPKDQTFYVNRDTQVACEHIVENGSGLKSVEIYAAYGEEYDRQGIELYREKKEAWTKSDRIVLNREGNCRVWIRMEDMVGNIQFQRTGDIVIDRTGPKLQFFGIEGGSANNRTVEPGCRIEDTYLNPDGIKLTLTGYHSGVRNVSWERKAADNGSEIRMQMEDLPHERNWDDIYTLLAEAEDLAGNHSMKKIVFSVNRFGSVYYLGESTKDCTERFYISKPEDMEIYEVNVDYLTESGIMLGYEGETRQLVKNRDYTVEKTGNDRTWKEYRYTIAADCFKEEGRYYLICASEDRAQNTSDNRMRKQKLEFAVDRSEPQILLAGIEDRGIYRSDEKSVSLECRDNLALHQVTVWLNGENIRKNDKEEQQIRLKHAAQWQTIRAEAIDKAGNTKNTGEIRFWLGKQPVHLPDEEETEEKMQTVQGEKKNLSAEEIPGKTSGQGIGKYWAVIAGIAVFTAIIAIFLKANREK